LRPVIQPDDEYGARARRAGGGVRLRVESEMTAEAYFERIDAETFLATHATESPWDERLQHGSPPTALLARAMLDTHPRDDMRLARITAEFLGPIPRAEVRVRTRVLRPGKRIELLEASLESGGREVVNARAWRIAVQPPGSVPAATTPPDPVPALPGPQEPRTWLRGWGYAESMEWRYVSKEGPGPATLWARPRIPLIAGEPLQPLDRALLLVDSANGISGELPMDQWLFVPPSLTVALERYPRGEWVLLQARTTLADDGIGLCTSRLADVEDFIGSGTQALLVERRA
jgi:acyl-CoA thioesterase superfamily protein/acyl-Coa thioesterase superfamily protein